jgi:phosphoglycerate dehydrogenase-like enzyme
MPPIPRVFVGPRREPAVVAAIEGAGGEVVSDTADATAVVWLEWDDKDGVLAALHPGITWVQLPSAGVDAWLAAGVIDDARTWTTASDAFAHPVAEHALALLLAATRKLGDAARATSWDRPGLVGTSLRGTTVAIIGAGGIGRALMTMLAPLGAEVLAVNRSGRPVEGVRETLPTQRRAEAYAAADAVVLSAPATADTSRMIDARALAAFRPGAILVNIARGTMVDTDAVLAALDGGTLGAVALDVTDPEPLPDGHPLWHHPRVLVTPHTATPDAVIVPTLAALVGENVARLRDGRGLRGVVRLDRGY